MTDTQAIIALVTAAAGGLVGFAKWALSLWAAVRREAIAAAKETAVNSREDNEKRTAALIEQAKANVVLAERIDELGGKLDTAFAKMERWQDSGPVSDRRRRAARDTDQD